MPRPSRRAHSRTRRNPDDWYPSDDVPFGDDVPFDVEAPILGARPADGAPPGVYDFTVDGQPVARMAWSPGAGAFQPGAFGSQYTAPLSREFRGTLPGPAPRAFVDPWPTFHAEPRVAQQQPTSALAQRAARADDIARAAQAAMFRSGVTPRRFAELSRARAQAWRDALTAHEALGQITRESCAGAIGGEVPGPRCLADVGSMGGAEAAGVRVQCDRVVPVSKYAEWALAGLPHGPHEMEKPHIAGSTPCCYYHPATAERLRLQGAVRQAWYDGKLGERATETDLAQAIADAEDRHPLSDVWQDCDAQTMDAVARYDPGMGGKGSNEIISAVQRFVMLVRKGLDDNARELWRYIAEDTNARIGYREAVALDADFIDTVMSSYATHATKKDRTWWDKNFPGFDLPPPRRQARMGSVKRTPKPRGRRAA
jgi:hypothetical protein